MTKIAFTICSNNYLSQALVLKESFLGHHPEYKFFIGLVDDIIGIENIFPDLEVIPICDLGISEFGEMADRYNITELNTSVKPFYFEYIFSKLNAEWVIYIDPDICVYNRFEEVEDFLTKGAEVVLTPHILSPVGESDICYIREGIFNLGFVAFSANKNVFNFLKWWRLKLINEGYFSYSKNLFYDQLWMNMSIAFLRKVSVLYHPGYNIAGWNLFERKLIQIEGTNYVNEKQTKLIFFHFSGVTFDKNDLFISKHYPQVTVKERPDLKEVLYNYRSKVIGKKHEEVKKITPVFSKKTNRVSLSFKVRFFIFRFVKKILYI